MKSEEEVYRKEFESLYDRIFQYIAKLRERCHTEECDDKNWCPMGHDQCRKLLSLATAIAWKAAGRLENTAEVIEELLRQHFREWPKFLDHYLPHVRLNAAEVGILAGVVVLHQNEYNDLCSELRGAVRCMFDFITLADLVVDR